MKEQHVDYDKLNVEKIIRICEKAIESGRFNRDEKKVFRDMKNQVIVNRSIMGDKATSKWFLTQLMIQGMMYEDENL